MCQAIQEMRAEARREGEQVGELRGEQRGRLLQAQESAGKLYEMGMAPEKIAEVIGYTAETVRQWIEAIRK